MIASQIGIVNSSAKTVASGSRVRLSAQTYCEAKCTLLRTKIETDAPRRELRADSGLHQRERNRMKHAPKQLRTVRISKMVRHPRDSGSRAP